VHIPYRPQNAPIGEGFRQKSFKIAFSGNKVIDLSSLIADCCGFATSPSRHRAT
jgi:hypothetical protein